jgi:glycosyltransferase involved in cell wall biosynthesis
MNVAFVTHYATLYGANRSLLALIDGLRADYAVQPLVVLPEAGPMAEALASRDVPFMTVLMRGWMAPERWKAPLRLAINFSSVPRLARRLRAWDPDLIHTNTSVTPFGALVAAYLGCPHTWHVREFGDLDFGFRHDWGRGVFAWGLSEAQAVVAVSEAVRARTLRRVQAPCHVVYNGVVSHAQAQTLGRDDDAPPRPRQLPTFALVGRIQPEKGQVQAVRALRQLAAHGCAVRLLLAGTGRPEHEAAVRHEARRMGVADHVEWLGFVDDPFSVYRRADAVLVCSPHEAMGRVTVEAMAAARPVIGYDSDGTAELVEHERDGLLYDGTVAGLATCMRRCIDHPAMARAMGRRGWKKACRHFTHEAYAQRMYPILRRAAAGHSDPHASSPSLAYRSF